MVMAMSTLDVLARLTNDALAARGLSGHGAWALSEALYSAYQLGRTDPGN